MKKRILPVVISALLSGCFFDSDSSSSYETATPPPTPPTVPGIPGENQAPVIGNIDTLIIEADTIHELQIRATDPDGDALSYALVNAPAWATIDATGKITFAPSSDDATDSTYSITVEVSDGSLIATVTFDVDVLVLDGEPPPPMPTDYTGKLSFNNKVVTGDVACDGMVLGANGEFAFSAIEGVNRTIQCQFGAITSFVTINFSDSTGNSRAIGDENDESTKMFDALIDGDLAEHGEDAFRLLNKINRCPTEPDKLCLDALNSIEIAHLYRSGNKDAIEEFLNTVVPDENKQPSTHIDPDLTPVVTPGTSTNLTSTFVAANAESVYEYSATADNKPLTVSRLTDNSGKPMAGIEYFSNSAHGFTNSNGEFEYLWGEQLVFAIDTFTLGQTKGNKVNYTLSDLSANELVQQNIETLVARYGIGSNLATTEKVRSVFAEHPNVINALISLNLPNGAEIEGCVVGGQPCTTPNEFIDQFAHGIAQQIDMALSINTFQNSWHPPRMLRAGSGTYVTDTLQGLYDGVASMHIFHDNKSFYGASGYARSMRNFNITNKAFPIFMPRSDNNFWMSFGEEAAWTRGSGVDKKAFFVDSSLLGQPGITMARPDLVGKDNVTYALPTMAAGGIGEGKVVFLGNLLYTSLLSCPNNYWANRDLVIDAEGEQKCYYQSPHNPEAQEADINNDHGSMQRFVSNLITWLAPQYDNGAASLSIGSNIAETWAFRHHTTEGYRFPFFVDDSYNIDVVTVGSGNFQGLSPETTPVLFLQSYAPQAFEDGRTGKVISNPDAPLLTTDDITALIQYVDKGGNIIFFDALEKLNPEPIARLADAAGVAVGGANVAITHQTNCENSYYCQTIRPNLQAISGDDIVVYTMYPTVGSDQSGGISVDPATGTVIWPSDASMLANKLQIPQYVVTTENRDGSVTEISKYAFFRVKSEEEKQAAIDEIRHYISQDIPLCKDDYQFEVNCIEFRPGNGMTTRGNYGRPDFDRMTMSPEVVDTMVTAANLGSNIDQLLAHELYFRTKGTKGKRLAKAELTATYDNLSVWLWNDTQYEYVANSAAGDELGFKRATEILNCYTNDAHGGGTFCPEETRQLLMDPDGNPSTNDGMLNAIGEVSPHFPLNWMEKPLTRIMLGRAFWDHDIVVDSDGYLPRPTVAGSSEAVQIHTHGKTVSSSAGNMQSTGLWAAQHRNITVSGGVPATITVALVDDITGRAAHELALKRPPRVQQSFRHNGSNTTLSVPYGGLIYIQPLEEAASDLVEFRFTNVIKAPLWKDGAWVNPLNDSVPLAEIDTGHFVYTTPVNNATGADIATFAEQMNLFAESASDFYGRDEVSADGIHRRFTSAELPGHRHRFVNDAQISIGTAHSGYPVQNSAFNKAATTLPTKPTNDWLLWHEIGHNLAAAPFNITGSTEVSNNILALYMQEKRADKPFMERIAIDIQKIPMQLSLYPGHAWSVGDAGLRLAMFGQLKLWGEDHFDIANWYPDAATRPAIFDEDEGWNMIKMAHRMARDTNAENNYCSAEQTGLNQGDLLMLCLSYVSGYDLSEYFLLWNPSESKADLPDHQVIFSGGITARGVAQLKELNLPQPPIPILGYDSVEID